MKVWDGESSRMELPDYGRIPSREDIDRYTDEAYERRREEDLLTVDSIINKAKENKQ